MTKSLYDRLSTDGTISETPQDIPDPKFALPSTIHWMRALAILVAELGLDFPAAEKFYSHVAVRALPPREMNTVFEQLLFALNQIAALRAIGAAPNKADVARIAIVTWYYGIYGTCSAMISAENGTFQDNHAATARDWGHLFPKRAGLAMPPFSDRLSSVLDATVIKEMAPVRARGVHPLVKTPTNATEAWGCVSEYLSGTATYQQWAIREDLKSGKEFKALGVADFKTKAARGLRDKAYERRSVAFPHQAFRYRGKANYRDAIYLAYGKSVPKRLENFIVDLEQVLIGFTRMAGGYISRKIGSSEWSEFIDDLETKRAISVSPREIWG